jgi:hypothetical protein
MKIITAYPIIENGKLVGNKIAANTLNYSSANGKPKKQRGGLVGSGKVKGFLEKSGGVATALAGILGGGAAAASQDSAPIVTEEKTKEKVKEPMKLWVKIALGVGVAAVLGLGVYFVMKNKNKK